MIHNDRERFLLSAGVAVALHALLFVVLAVVGLDFTPYPETSPVYVTLPDYELPEEPEPEPEPEIAVEEPVEAPPAEVVTEPVEPEPEPAEPEPVPQEPSAEPAPATPPEPAPAIRSEPAQQQTPEASPPIGRDAPPGSFSQDDLPWLNDDSDDRQSARPSSEDLFAIEEPDQVSDDLPSWVVEGEFSIQPEASLDPRERETLDEKREASSEFERRLEELTEALENPPEADTSGSTRPGTSGTATSPGDSTTAIPGGGSIEWVGSGSRRPVGELALPALTASDFGGQVPARISYLIVFDVNENGLVVPGSLILRQSSGYTLADQKVRRAVSTWRFDRAPGAPPVTAIATLHIARDQIR